MACSRAMLSLCTRGLSNDCNTCPEYASVAAVGGEGSVDRGIAGHCETQVSLDGSTLQSCRHSALMYSVVVDVCLDLMFPVR